MKLGIAFIAALALLGVFGAGCAKAAPGDSSESITVNGVRRTYVLHVPDGITGRVPLILSFHGHGGDGAQQARLTGFDALSDRYGFIIAYPDGIDRAWNDGRPVNAKGPDDLAFAGALVDDLEHRYSIDPARVYATGFSNGAVFSNYLACNQANRFAAIAPVSGPMPVVDAPNCHPQRAVSFLEISGTADPIVPFDGGQIVLAGMNRGEVLSFAQTGAFWAKNARLRRQPDSDTASGDRAARRHQRHAYVVFGLPFRRRDRGICRLRRRPRVAGRTTVLTEILRRHRQPATRRERNHRPIFLAHPMK